MAGKSRKQYIGFLEGKIVNNKHEYDGIDFSVLGKTCKATFFDTRHLLCLFLHRCDLTSETCVAGSIHIPMLKKTKTSRRRQKPQKMNLDEKVIFKPGPFQEENPIEDVGFHP